MRPRSAPCLPALAVLIACAAAWFWIPQPATAGHFAWDQGHDTFTPEGSPPPDEHDPTCNDSGSPFQVATGNFTYRFEDFSANVFGPGLRFARTYNSRDLRNGPFGRGWSHTYDVRLLDLTDGVTIAAVCRKGTGKRFRFQRNPDGSYSPPSDFYSELTELPDGSFSLVEADRTTKSFDADGLLIAIADRDGNALSFVYDNAGFLTSITTAVGLQVLLTKGANGKIASVSDPMGRIFQYDYDVEGRLTTVTNPLTETTTFVYGADGRLAQILDSLGRIVQDLSYDPEGRVTGYIENGVAWTVAYTPAENKAVKTNPAGDVWTIYYNENGNVIERVDPLGGRRLWTYDSNYRQASFTDESGVQTTYTYDARGNTATQTDALNNTTTWAYDPVTGHLVSKTDAQDRTTNYFYDAHRLVRVEDPEGVLYRLEYYPNGQVHRRIDANGQAMTYVYNLAGLLESVTTPEGGQTTFEYDGAGNQTAAVDPDGIRQESVYDDLNRLVIRRDSAGNETTLEYAPGCPVCSGSGKVTSTVDASGREVSTEYDQYGRRVRIVFPDLTETQVTYDSRGYVATRVDQAGEVTLFTHDALGRQTAIQQPGIASSMITYDASGRVIGLVDPGGEAATFGHDAVGRQTSTTSAATGNTAATYTPDGLLATRTDGRGIQTSYGYDSRGRQLTQSFPDPLENITFGWDEAASANGGGRLTSVLNPSGSTRSHYDLDGRLVRVDAFIEGVTYSTEYAYTLAGRAASVTYPSGLEVVYSMDTRGLVQSITLEDASVTRSIVTSAIYDPDGRLVSMTYGNGLVESRTYDAVGRIESISVAGTEQVVYGRDARGNVTAATDQLDPLRNRSYGYDPTARLTTATGPWGNLSYTYDDAGNRLTRTGSSGTSTYQYIGNRLNSISGSESASYTYDPAGNMLSNGVRVYSYSQFGRLVSASDGPGTTNYRYNASNQRVIKESPAGTSVYHYDQQGRLIEESDASGNVLVSYLYWDGWRPLAQIVGGEIYFYHVDQIDTPRVLTDEAQLEVWRGELYPFGEVYQESGSASQLLRFPGQVWDSEAQLSYNWYRWYEPGTGRYTRVDPLGIEVSGELSTYLYVYSNPLAASDPLGLKPEKKEWSNCSDLPSPPSPCDCDPQKTQKYAAGARELRDLFCKFRNSPQLPPGVPGSGEDEDNALGIPSPPRYRDQEDPCVNWCICEHERQHQRDLDGYGPKVYDVPIQQGLNYMECRGYNRGLLCIQGLGGG